MERVALHTHNFQIMRTKVLIFYRNTYEFITVINLHSLHLMMQPCTVTDRLLKIKLQLRIRVNSLVMNLLYKKLNHENRLEPLFQNRNMTKI